MWVASLETLRQKPEAAQLGGVGVGEVGPDAQAQGPQHLAQRHFLHVFGARFARGRLAFRWHELRCNKLALAGSAHAPPRGTSYSGTARVLSGATMCLAYVALRVTYTAFRPTNYSLHATYSKFRPTYHKIHLTYTSLHATYVTLHVVYVTF